MINLDLSNVLEVRYHRLGKDRHGYMHKHQMLLFVALCARSIMDARSFHGASFAAFETYTCGLPYAWSHGSTRPEEVFYLETMLDDGLLPTTLVRYSLPTICPIRPVQ